MFKNFGFNAEKENFKSRVLNVLIKKVYAEDEGNGDSDKKDDSNDKNRVDFEVLIQKARQEEKEKLYPKIKKLEEDIKKYQDSNNDKLLTIATLKEEKEKMQKEFDSNTDSKALKDEIEALKEENKKLKESTPKVEEIEKRIRDEYEIKMYTQKVIQDNKEKFFDVFSNEIQGATKEEVDASLEKVVAKSKTIKEQLGTTDTTPPAGTPPDKNTNPPSSNPSGRVAKNDFKIEDIRNLDPRSPEYKEFRKKLGLK
jgi:DNA repair exonuclease SbcCD ATPase subunit